MIDNDLTHHLEDVFSDTTPEPQQTGHCSLHRGIVADLLEGEVVTRPGTDEPSISGALLSTHTNLEAGKNQDRSLFAGAYVSFILVGLLLVSLLIGFIWPTLIALSGFRVLYLAVCVLVLVGTVIRWKLNSSLADALRKAEAERTNAVLSRTRLEERVQELIETNALLQQHTLQSERASQISRALSAIRERGKLMQEAVNLVCDLYDLYYVGLFVIDESEHWAVLRCVAISPGVGQAGGFDHPMLTQGYRLEVGGASTVSRCIASTRDVIARDFDEQALQLTYTLLPGARSEMTLFLQSRGRVIGALDLQSSVSQAFSQDSIEGFRMVVDQLALAIGSAQSLAELDARSEMTEELRRHHEREQQLGFILDPAPSLYECTQPGVAALGGKEFPELEQAMAQRKMMIRTGTNDDGNHAALVVPITLRGEVMGALGFYEEHGRQWTAHEIALVEDVTRQVGLAVENVRLFEQTQTALDETDALYRASRAIAAADSVEDIVQAIVGSLSSPRVDHCYLGIFDSPGGKLSDDLVIVASWSQTEEELWRTGTLLSLNQHLMGERIGRNQPLILSDVVAEEGLDRARQDELVTAGVRSLAVVPLVAVGGWIGVLVVAASRSGAITEHNLQPYLTLAGQAALSIERSSLFKQTQEALEETSMLYRASRAIGAATSVSEVARALLEAVTTAQFDCGMVLIRRPAVEQLEVVAGWDRKGDVIEVGTQMDIDHVPPRLTIFSNPTLDQALQPRDDPTTSPGKATLLRQGVWPQWVSEGEGVTLASVPVLFRGQLLGALLVARQRQDQLLDEKTLQPFVTLTAQAAVAIENRRLFEETRRAAEQEALLNEMLRNLATALDVGAIIQTVQDPLARLVPFDYMTVALVNDETSTLEVFHPISEETGDAHVLSKGQIVSLQETLIGQVINTRRTTVFDLTDSSLIGVEVEPLRRAGAQTCIVIPLVYGRDVLGSLSLAHSSPNAYTMADVPLLERVAQLTAVAMENARLFGQLSQRAVQLRTAAQVSQAATSILNLDQLLAQTVELIRDRFGLYYVGLFMVDGANEWAVLQAGTGEAGRVQLEQGHRLQIGGGSMIGWCVANAQPRIALDVGEEAIHFDNPALTDTRSELALPLISRGETIGALSVQSTSPAAFSHEDVTTLQTMAGQLANAIQNARFVEQTQKALAETEALYVTSSELNTAQRYEDILATLRRHTLVGQGAQDATLNLFDHPWTSGRIPEWIEVPARWTRLSPEAVSPRYRLSALPSAARLLSPDLPTLVEDVVSDPRFDDNARALYLEHGAKSTIFIPLVVGGQWIGFVNALYHEPTVFPEVEVRRLMALAGQAAVAVQGLRQLHEIEARARREALIREITGKIRATADLEAILQTTVTEVSKALGTSHGAIRLGIEKSPEGSNSQISSTSVSPHIESSSAENVVDVQQEDYPPPADEQDNAAHSPQPQLERDPTSPPCAGKGGQE